MQSLILLIKQYRTFLLFFALECLSLWMLVNNNHYQRATFFSSANRYIGTVLSWSEGVKAYFSLRSQNEELTKENAYLHYLLSIERQKRKGTQPTAADSSIFRKYDFTTARVVNNSTRGKNNYITIDKGRLDGIEKDMGVISPMGIVGKVSACSDHFSLVISLLHSQMSVSAQIKKNNELGSVQWNGLSPRYAKLREISSHLNVKKGDTVVTSGYNATFPPKVMVGVIDKVKTRSEQTFYDIDLKLSSSFNNLSHVYVIKNLLKIEQDSLQAETFEEINE